MRKANFRTSLLAVGFILPIMWASKAPCPYTKFQIESWVMGGGEGFRDSWYPDGKTPSGVQKYSIGHGYNDWGTKARRDEIAKYTKDGLTWDESMEISRKELSKIKTTQSDYYTDIAFRLHIYNTGRCKSVSELARCRGGRAGCGSPLENVRKSHNVRRKLEVALASHNFEVANEIIEILRDRKVKEYRAYMKSNNKTNEKEQRFVEKRDQDVPVSWIGSFFRE